MRTPRMWLCGAAAFVVLGGCAHEEASVSRADVAHDAGQQPLQRAVSKKAPPAPQTATTTTPASPELPAPSAPDPLAYLSGPTLEDWQLVAAPSVSAEKGFDHWAEIDALSVPLYAAPDGKKVVGATGVGNRLPAREVDGRGCAHGDWYQVTGDAYLCSAEEGVRITSKASPDTARETLVRALIPHVDRPAPYRYGKARRAALLLKRLPTASELAQVNAGNAPADLLSQTLDGTYLLSLVDEPKVGSESFYRTLTGGYVRASDVKPFPPPPMHGEHLGRRVHLPLAFTTHKTPLYCVDAEEPTPCGVADKHARFEAGDEVQRDGHAFLLVRDSLLVPRENVRVARRIARPSGVSRSERWVNVDLSEQTLVAYAGDTPVFATLVSSGKTHHDTVTGLFRVQRAFLTKTMNGKDDDGPYSVQEVPWTMYFYGNYALHGAYWHDVFGGTRSHGCVNIPPVDARWLFYWSKSLPAGWTARVGFQGIHVYVTGHTPSSGEADAAQAS